MNPWGNLMFVHQWGFAIVVSSMVEVWRFSICSTTRLTLWSFFGRWNWCIQRWNICAHGNVKLCLLCRWRWHKVVAPSCKHLGLMMRVNKATTSGTRGLLGDFLIKKSEKDNEHIARHFYNRLLTTNRQKKFTAQDTSSRVFQESGTQPVTLGPLFLGRQWLRKTSLASVWAPLGNKNLYFGCF